MASSRSVGFTLTAGGLMVANDIIVGPFTWPTMTKRAIGTVVACFVGVGIDMVVPGLGTSLAVILAITAAIKVGPGLAHKVFP